MSPKITFIVGGVQKAGTTALASYLSMHPGLRIPAIKEAHVFDSADFPTQHSAEFVESRFRSHFIEEDWTTPSIRLGDATPITIFRSLFLDRVFRYNPAMRWIVMLRDPVARAISQWHMERSRRAEAWPMWAAFLLEPWRLMGRADDWRIGSPMRHHSYVSRSRYVSQIRALHERFPSNQILLVNNVALAERPGVVLDRIATFLHVDPLPFSAIDSHRLFEGGYRAPGVRHLASLIARWRLGSDASILRRMAEEFPDLEYIE